MREGPNLVESQLFWECSKGVGEEIKNSLYQQKE